MIEKQILYDSSTKQPIAKKIRNYKISRGVGGLFGGVFLPLYGVWTIMREISAGVPPITSISTYGIFIILLIFIGFHYFFNALTIEHLKIFEDGILHPERRTLKMFIEKKHFIIPFSEIECIYPNINQHLPYLIIKVSENFAKNLSSWTWSRKSHGIILEKDFIYDMGEFIKILEGKVKIVKETDWRLS